MVDIHSITASSQPSHREPETEREVTFRSWAGRPRRAGGRFSATTAATATQHRRSARTVQTRLPVADVGATLAASRQLLNNPPSAHASPSAMKQWRHDVDQLIVTTINTPHHEGGWQLPSAAHSRSPSAARAPPYVCMPHQLRMLLSIATTDLHDELIHRCWGEDSQITIECHRERHCNIEGCNLDRDFESLAPTQEVPAARVVCPPSNLADSGGVWHLHPICQRSMMGQLTSWSSCRSTPPPSSL
jgi:hypothetical protein